MKCNRDASKFGRNNFRDAGSATNGLKTIGEADEDIARGGEEAESGIDLGNQFKFSNPMRK